MSGSRPRRGTALVLIVLLSVIVTGLVLTLAWAAGVQSQVTGSLTKVDTAFYSAEAGLQRAGWYIRNGQIGSLTQPLTGSINGFNYSVTWSTSGNGYKVTSAATNGTISNTVVGILTAPVVLPAYTLGGAGSAPGATFNLKNLTINGNVAFAGGVYASGGNAQINGSITYGTTFAPDHITVTGTATQKPATVPTIDYNMLKSKAQGTGTVYNSSQNNKTFDFTAIPGPNPVIYVQGNVNNPTFIGSGTIVATGSISLSANVGASGTPVNVVAMGDVSNSGGQFTLFGSIYAGGNWNHSATFNITGPVTITGVDNSGNTASGTMNSGATPWFDPRTTTGSGVTLTNFGGLWP